MAESRPLLEGLFRQAEDGPALVGSLCEGCGRTHFPHVARCLDCLGTALQDVDLPRTGTLFSFTSVHLKSANFGPGQTVGYVDLGGVRVFAPLDERSSQPYFVGQPVQLEVLTLWRDSEGVDVVGYRFVPGGTGDRESSAHA